MKNIVATWTVEATAGTVGVNENTFQFAIIARTEARNEAAAIKLVGAKAWRPSGNKSVVSVSARKTWAFENNVGDEEHGQPGSIAPSDFDSLEDAQEFLRDEEEFTGIPRA